MKMAESANGTVRLTFTTDEWQEISEAFYSAEQPQEAQFEDESGRRTIVFILERAE